MLLLVSRHLCALQASLDAPYFLYFLVFEMRSLVYCLLGPDLPEDLCNFSQTKDAGDVIFEI